MSLPKGDNVANLILACIMLIPAGIAFFKNKTADTVWWAMFVLINLNIGLFSLTLEKINNITELLSATPQ